jgi:ATP-dependent helicase/DNAse subunit B
MSMRQSLIAGLALAVAGVLLLGQAVPPEQSREDPRLKRKQIEDLLKAEHEKSLEDAAQLIKLSEDLKIELEKGGRHVISVSAYKKTEEIEKVAKRIRGRMKRF